MPVSFRPTAGLAAVALAASTLVVAGGPAQPAAAATSPGSIVYVKNHNVWIADGDGGSQRQVTRGGTARDPWRSPTQSDTGYVVAHRSGLVYRMNQRGEVFTTMDPPDLVDAIGNTVRGRDLTETAISPDGSKIAYTYFKFALGEKRWVTGFTSASSPTDPERWGMAFYDKPSWVTNSRVAVNAWYRNRTHLYDLGSDDAPWFDERDYRAQTVKQISDVEVSRDGAWVVATRGEPGDESVVFAQVNGDVQTGRPTAPSSPCEIGPDDPQLREPTIAPDSSTMAWAEPDGIWKLGGFTATCDPSTSLTRIIPGGSDPSWSKAAIGHTPRLRTFTARSAPKVTGTVRTGRTVKASRGSWSPYPSSYGFQWLRDGRAIARATKQTYRVAKADKRHRISVKVTVRKAGYVTRSRTSPAIRVSR